MVFLAPRRWILPMRALARALLLSLAKRMPGVDFSLLVGRGGLGMRGGDSGTCVFHESGDVG